MTLGRLWSLLRVSVSPPVKFEGSSRADSQSGVPGGKLIRNANARASAQTYSVRIPGHDLPLCFHGGVPMSLELEDSGPEAP